MNLTWISVIHQFQIRSGFRNNRFYLKGSICFRFIFLRLSLCVCVYLCVCNWSEVWYGPWAHDVRQSNHHSRFVSSYKRTDITEGGKRTYCYWWGPACAIFFTSPSNPLTPPSPPAMDAQNTLYSTRNNCFCLEGVWIGAPLRSPSSGEGGSWGTTGRFFIWLLFSLLLLLLCFFSFSSVSLSVSLSLGTRMSSVNGEWAFFLRRGPSFVTWRVSMHRWHQKQQLVMEMS